VPGTRRNGIEREAVKPHRGRAIASILVGVAFAGLLGLSGICLNGLVGVRMNLPFPQAQFFEVYRQWSK
jgi:hypothetical protein